MLCIILVFSCSPSDDPNYRDQQNGFNSQTVNENDDDDDDTDVNSQSTEDIKLLSLGDSYTIGQSVCATCRFPVQLKDSLINQLERNTTVDIINS